VDYPNPSIVTDFAADHLWSLDSGGKIVKNKCDVALSSPLVSNVSHHGLMHPNRSTLSRQRNAFRGLDGQQAHYLDVRRRLKSGNGIQIDELPIVERQRVPRECDRPT